MYTKHLIVGAGVAGLNIASQLQSQREPFLVFEAQNKVDEDGWKRFASFLRLGYKVVSIDKTPTNSFYVELEDGVKYIAKHLYVCTSTTST